MSRHTELSAKFKSMIKWVVTPIGIVVGFYFSYHLAIHFFG